MPHASCLRKSLSPCLPFYSPVSPTPISQSVQPVLITPPALSEAQLQQLLGKLPKGAPGLRAGDKVTPFASAPPLSSLRIVGIRNGTKYESITSFQTNTNNSFSQGTFEVISLEQGYGQSQASYGATTPRLYASQAMCNPASWRKCTTGEPAEGFLNF